MFAKNSLCRDVVTRASVLYHELLGPYGAKVLHNGLHRLSMNILHSKAGKSPCMTHFRDELVDYTLPADSTKCLRLLMRETLFEYMEDHKHSYAYRSSTGKDVELPPAQVQQFIVKNFPEMIACHPELYEAALLDTHRPGLHTVVQSLLAMSCDKNEMQQGVRAWLTSQTKKPGVSANTTEELPNDMFTFS